MSELALEVSDLSFHYPATEREILRTLTFHVNQGEFVAILGPSGCGKSSLLHLLAGFLQPSHGSILTFGTAVSGPGPDRGVLFQQDSLFPWYTARENIAYALRSRRLSRWQAMASSLRWLTIMGLEEFGDNYPSELSGGMRQRVALARLFAGEHSVFLMDEPFGALDAHTRFQMQELLLHIWDSSSGTVLFVTHDSEEAIYLADRVLVMSSRPGSIIDEFTVPLGRPRNVEDLFDPQIISVRQHVFTLLREEHVRSRIAESKRSASQGLLRIGYVPDPGSLPLLCSDAEELQPEANGSLLIEKIGTGHYDLAEVSLVAALLAANRGCRFRILGGWRVPKTPEGDSGIAGLAVERELAQSGLKRLSTSRVGINGFGTLTEFLVRLAFENENSIPELVSLNPSTYRFAIERQIVEAVALFEPWLSEALQSNAISLLAYLDVFLPPSPHFVLVANEEVMRKREIEIRAMITKVEAGMRQVGRGAVPSFRTSPLLIEYIKEKAPELDFGPLVEVELDSIEGNVDALERVGMIKLRCNDLAGLLL